MKAFYQLPPTLSDDINELAEHAAAFERGELAAADFKHHHTAMGVYEQRQDGQYMVRVRAAAGMLNPVQLRLLADLSRRLGDGVLHLTTRQDVQLHGLKLSDVPGVMRELQGVGLASKGGGGNTLRNVTTCPYAGACPNECFDVRPVAAALTDYLLTLPGSFTLPRKYKIAISGCRADCAHAAVADLGLAAAMQDGKAGFVTRAAGGLGANPRLSVPLRDFLPVEETLWAAEAIRRIFDRIGDRTNRRRARLRFAVERIGADAFREMFGAEHQTVADEGHTPTVACIDPDRGSDEVDAMPVPPDLTVRGGIRVLHQRQHDQVALFFFPPLGNLDANAATEIAELAERFSQTQTLRLSQEQHLYIQDVATSHLDALAETWTPVAAALNTPQPLSRFVSCTGAAMCRLGICLSTRATQACAAALAEAKLDFDALDHLKIRVSGCPNSCGQHWVGEIGFSGGARRSEDRSLPAYQVYLGHRGGFDYPKLGERVGTVPAKRLPQFLVDLVQDYLQGRDSGESIGDYCADGGGRESVEKLLEQYAELPAYADDPDAFRDWGCTTDFTP